MPSPVKRLHHLDAARALLLLLGLPFHVATKAIFESEPPAVDFQQSMLIGGWASLTHVFRMFAFFMLAGYFAGMIRERNGTKAWLAERTRRLGLPFAASLITLGALQFRLQDLLLHKPSPSFLGLPLALDHLWFLIVLMGFCVTYAAVPVERLNPGNGVKRAMLLDGPGGLALLACLALWGLVRYATELAPAIPNAPSETLLWQQYVFHAAGFALGVLAWHGQLGERLFALRNRWIIPGITVLLMLYVPLDPLIRPALGKEIYPDLAGTLTLRALELPLAYLMSLGLFRLLAWAVRGPNKVVTFFVDGALAIYLFHLAWAMIVLPQARALPLPAEAQWLFSACAVLLLAVLSYLVVRTTTLTSILFCGALRKPAPTSPASASPAQVG
ncbi:MAG: acyltransferase family protein [Novosphingobium sp.]